MSHRSKSQWNRRRLTAAVAGVALALLTAFFVTSDARAAERDPNHLIVTTWNIEILGGEGRGFAGGHGRGQLGPRTPEQLQAIASLIKNTLRSDVLAVQEISITRIGEDGQSICEPLETIVSALGPDWRYYLPPVTEIPEGHDNMYCGFVWNSSRARMLKAFPMEVPNVELAGANLFDREPVVGYFEALSGDEGRNDFMLANVHLKSGQSNEENHLIAITVVEHALYKELLRNEVKESDRIILGDFNDNPYARSDAGNQKYSPALYYHLAFKGYQDLVTRGFHATRMDEKGRSVIDHILVHKSAKRHIPNDRAAIYLPNDGDARRFGQWRKTYSDHFPISFQLRIESRDDDVDFRPAPTSSGGD